MESIPITDPNVPVWLDGLKWIFVALLLSLAIVGPRLLGPFIDRMNAKSKVVAEEMDKKTTMAVVGAAIADKDAVLQLTLALNRLCAILERRVELDEEEDEQDRLNRLVEERIANALTKLSKMP